jgi:hypothetical protein
MFIMGVFHLTGIPEILLENQMNHVNFWNAVSKIPDNLSRLSTNWKFRNFRNFYIPLKHFPTNVAAFQKFLSKNRRGPNKLKSTINVENDVILV